LLPHFKREFLFCELPSDNNLRLHAELEHKTIYKMSEGLNINLSDKSLPQNFVDTLEKHIRFKERQLLNYQQDNISENKSLKIAAALKVREHEDESAWTDAFWEKGK